MIGIDILIIFHYFTYYRPAQTFPILTLLTKFKIKTAVAEISVHTINKFF